MKQSLTERDKLLQYIEKKQKDKMPHVFFEELAAFYRTISSYPLSSKNEIYKGCHMWREMYYPHIPIDVLDQLLNALEYDNTQK